MDHVVLSVGWSYYFVGNVGEREKQKKRKGVNWGRIGGRKGG